MLADSTMNGASLSRPVQRLLERLEGVETRNGSYQALCPAHEDRQPSLNLSEGEDGRALIKCFAGCTPERITDALGLQMNDLFEHHNGSPAQRRKPSGPPAQPATRQHSPCTLRAYASRTSITTATRRPYASDSHFRSTPTATTAFGGAGDPNPPSTASGDCPTSATLATSFSSRARATV